MDEKIEILLGVDKNVNSVNVDNYQRCRKNSESNVSYLRKSRIYVITEWIEIRLHQITRFLPTCYNQL